MFAQAEENLDAHKTKMAQNLDQRIASLQKMKGCIQAASNHEAMKACRETHRAEMDAVADANIDAKIQHLQERKAKRAHKN